MLGTFNIAIQVIVCLATILYAGFILFITLGLSKTKIQHTKGTVLDLPVSIIVAFKNEENNIIDCLKCLLQQSYCKGKTEIILVDDHSTDNSYNIVKECVKSVNEIQIKVLSLKQLNISSSKKNAIESAVAAATGHLIITTDADCLMKPNWIQSIVEFYISEKPKLILGPVKYKYSGGIFQKIQSLEFLSYIAAACGTAYFKKPILCNGANMAYEKTLFNEINPYDDNKNYRSGDDIFLMQKVIKKYGSSDIRFLKNPDSVVETFPENSLGGFLKQRVRWASKSKGYKDLFTNLSAYLVFIFNSLLLILLPLALINYNLIWLFLAGFSVRFLIDFTSYYMITKFMDQKKLLWYYFPLQLFYPLYIVVVGLYGTLKKN